MAQGKGREDSVDSAAMASPGDTSSAPGLLPRAPSCSARFSGAFTASAVPGQPEAPVPASAGTAGLRDGQQPSPGSHHGWVCSEGRHRREQRTRRDSMAWAEECLPGWHAASSLTCPAPKVTDSLDAALLSRAGTQISPITSLGTLNTSPQPRSLCPRSAAARSRLQVPLKTDGMQIIPPFQLLFKPCWPPLGAAAASHTRAGRAGTGAIWGARRAESSIHHSHTKKLLIQQRRGREPSLLKECSRGLSAVGQEELSLQKADLSQGG